MLHLHIRAHISLLTLPPPAHGYNHSRIEVSCFYIACFTHADLWTPWLYSNLQWVGLHRCTCCSGIKVMLQAICNTSWSAKKLECLEPVILQFLPKWPTTVSEMLCRKCHALIFMCCSFTLHLQMWTWQSRITQHLIYSVWPRDFSPAAGSKAFHRLSMPTPLPKQRYIKLC